MFDLFLLVVVVGVLVLAGMGVHKAFGLIATHVRGNPEAGGSPDGEAARGTANPMAPTLLATILAALGTRRISWLSGKYRSK